MRFAKTWSRQLEDTKFPSVEENWTSIQNNYRTSILLHDKHIVKPDEDVSTEPTPACRSFFDAAFPPHFT